jgi:hypothetical protein
MLPVTARPIYLANRAKIAKRVLAASAIPDDLALRAIQGNEVAHAAMAGRLPL